MLDVQDRGRVRTMTLNRPERLNALSLGMRTSLESVILGAAADPSVRVMVFTGAGERAF